MISRVYNCLTISKIRVVGGPPWEGGGAAPKLLGFVTEHSAQYNHGKLSSQYNGCCNVVYFLSKLISVIQCRFRQWCFHYYYRSWFCFLIFSIFSNRKFISRSRCPVNDEHVICKFKGQMEGLCRCLLQCVLDLLNHSVLWVYSYTTMEVQ